MPYGKDWLYELKYDGFRSLAYVSEGVKLVSRKGYTFTRYESLCAAIRKELAVKNAILDGEIACVNEHGYPVFNDLLFHRGTPLFFAFDLPWINGRDIRHYPLIERKKLLRLFIPEQSPFLRYVDHYEGSPDRFWDLVCNRDLEGIVCKPADSRYGSGQWLKLKNPDYSQNAGRRELFQRFRAATAVH